MPIAMSLKKFANFGNFFSAENCDFYKVAKLTKSDLKTLIAE